MAPMATRYATGTASAARSATSVKGLHCPRVLSFHNATPSLNISATATGVYSHSSTSVALLQSTNSVALPARHVTFSTRRNRHVRVQHSSGDIQPTVAGGTMSASLMASMKEKIGEALETQTVSITDVYGDGRHIAIDVTSPLFEGKSSMQRQRMVYKAIWFELQETVHAVDAMTTHAPGEQ